MWGRERTHRDPWCRAFIEITCHDTHEAACSGNEEAQELDDQMRIRNRGAVYVYARPGDNIWKLGLEALQVTPDMHTDSSPVDTLHEPGHA